MKKLWHWFVAKIIQPVPPELAYCEFICRKCKCPVNCKQYLSN